MLNTDVIDKKEICELIPHAGSMCLLDKVIEWDDNHIICSTCTHQDTDNPLRSYGVLATTALIEYGAQAMAVHGGLLAKQTDIAMQSGYLASLRDVHLDIGDVSQINTELCVEAVQQMSSGGNMIYNFSVTANKKPLISGRATVVAVFHGE